MAISTRRFSAARPKGYVSDGTDCDDDDETAYPGTERCECDDGLDGDRDGLIDYEDGDCADRVPCIEVDCDNDDDGATDCFDEDCWEDDGCDTRIRSYVLSGTVTGRISQEGHRTKTDFLWSSGDTSTRSASDYEERGRIWGEDLEGSAQLVTVDGSIIARCDWTAANVRFYSTYYLRHTFSSYRNGTNYRSNHGDLNISTGCAFDASDEELLPFVGAGVRHSIGSPYKVDYTHFGDPFLANCPAAGAWFDVVRSTSGTSARSTSTTRSSTVGSRKATIREVDTYETETFSGTLGEGDAFEYAECAGW